MKGDRGKPTLSELLDDAIADVGPPGGESFFRSRDNEPSRHRSGFASGTIIGDFKLLSMIGQGGMGQVWEAEQLSLGGRRVAVKFIRPGLITKRNGEYFAREARAVARVSHPGIVTVYGAGETEGVAWIAIELVEGGWTLRDMLDAFASGESRPANYPKQVARFVHELAVAAQAAHDEGVIHRDLKPQNVLVTTDNRPKLTDFGLAQIVGESALSETGDFAGTYLYISPEQIAAKRMGIDHRSDIFSLGVILYEMLALERPFQGSSTHEIAQQVLTKTAPSLRKLKPPVPDDLVVIAEKAMEKDRDMRYGSMAAMAEDLSRYLSNTPILAKPPSPLRRFCMWSRRNPTRTLLGAASLLAVATLAALSVFGYRAYRERDLLATERTELVSSAKRVSDLSLSVELIALTEDAKRLGNSAPTQAEPFEHWLQRANGLIARRPDFVLKREELRLGATAQAIDAIPKQLSQPVDLEISRLNEELDRTKRALAVRRGERAPDPMPDPSDPEGGVEDPSGASQSKNSKLLEASLSEGEASEQRGARLMELARTRFAEGDDEGAATLSYAALDAVGFESSLVEGQYVALEESIEEATSQRGLERAADRIRSLEVELARAEWNREELREWTFPGTKQGVDARWMHDELTELMGRIDALVDPKTGLAARGARSPEWGWSIPDRLAFADRLQAGFEKGGEFDRRWQHAMQSIRATYPFLELPVQVGLVPLQKNGKSGYWEFWHVQSGDEPLRDEAGQLELDGGSGLVFVLLPGGTFWMGTQGIKGQRNFSPAHQPHESPVHQVQLSAFFLSKYEMTQGQWMRLSGENPSRYNAQDYPVPPTQFGQRVVPEFRLTNPVEELSWVDCARLIPQFGIQLPSEAQWEYGARGGSTTAWWTGDERNSLMLRRAANLADQSAKAQGMTWDAIADWPEQDDGFPWHAYVDAFEPNDFGLYGVHGNVREWCADVFALDYYERSPGKDPLNLLGASDARVLRGGDFTASAGVSGSGSRAEFNKDGFINFVGLRPGRSVEFE